jgi:ABC-type Fe2+-enterobactin transport system substrate-binding protein|tara:strand:+ start:88 stop:315 length:228 start_codon:yes stop_codon:yes gene_type:complete
MMAQETTTEEMDKIVPVVVAKMEHQSFQSICDELGRSYQSLQQALRRRGILISMVKYGYKKKKLTYAEYLNDESY